MSEHHRTSDWTKTVNTWRPRIAAQLPMPCVDCGTPVLPGQKWQVGHRVSVAEATKLGWTTQQINDGANLGPSHSNGSGPGRRSCNQVAGAALGHRARWGTPTREDKRLPDWLAQRPAKPSRVSSEVAGHPEAEDDAARDSGDDNAVFEDELATPSMAATFPYPLMPDEFRDSGIRPLHVSSFAGSRAYRAEFIRGAEMLGLNRPRKEIHPQQFVIADALNAVDDAGEALFTTTAVCVPRRASKTTSIFAVAVGRCLERPGYLVAYTAQSGTKARERFLRDLVAPLERMYSDPKTRPFRILQGRGGERVLFDNGSMLVILPPLSESFRGDAYDLVILDEAQEHEPEVSEDLLGAIMPTFDTRPGAQLVVAGTTGESRTGMLWDALEDGRQGRANTGIVEYSAGDTLTEDEQAEPETWLRAHPGIGTLTTLKVVTERFEKMPRAQFVREYLGVWPTGGGGAFLNMDKWAKAADDGELPTPPARFSLAVVPHPDQTSGSIAAAWRDDDGRACILLLDHRVGVEWLAGAAVEYAHRFKTPVVHDTQGGAASIVNEAMQRSKPRPRFAPQTTRNVQAAAALFVRELDDGLVKHWGQPDLTAMAQLVTKRKILSGWGFGRADAEQDVTGIEAASLALRDYDNQADRQVFTPFVA